MIDKIKLKLINRSYWGNQCESTVQLSKKNVKALCAILFDMGLISEKFEKLGRVSCLGSLDELIITKIEKDDRYEYPEKYKGIDLEKNIHTGTVVFDKRKLKTDLGE